MTAVGAVTERRGATMSSQPDHDRLVDVLAHYEETLRAAGCSDKTVEARLTGVACIGQAAGHDPRWCSARDITGWLAAPHFSPWTRSTYFGHARAWCRFLVDAGYRGDDPTVKLRRPKSPRGVPRPLTAVQVSDLLATARGVVFTYSVLAAYAGLRVHEVAQVRGQDVTAAGLRVCGKGSVTGVVPIHPLVREQTCIYPQAGWWFPSTGKAGHISPEAVSRGIRRALLHSGLDAHPHQLRHFFGTEVLRAAGGDLRVAQELLRHSSPATTAVYTLVDDASRRAAVMRLPGA